MTQTSRSGVLRRNLMLGGMMAATSRAFGQTAKPLRLGYLNSLTGGAAYQAENNLNGMKLFFDSVGWTVAGRKLEIVAEDDQFNPQVGLQKAKKLMESDEVELIVGVQASNVALAVLNYMKQREGIFVVSGAGTNQLTVDPYAYLFRTSLSTYQLSEPMAVWASANLGKEAITVVSDYAGGRDVEANFRAAYEEAGGKLVQRLYPPLGTKDFGPYLIEVRSKAPPFIYAFMPGIEIVRFVQLFGDMQLQSKTKLTGFALADSQILSTVGKKALGTYTSTTFTDTIDSPQSRQFVQAYRAKYGAYPDIYSGIRLRRRAGHRGSGDRYQGRPFRQAQIGAGHAKRAIRCAARQLPLRPGDTQPGAGHSHLPSRRTRWRTDRLRDRQHGAQRPRPRQARLIRLAGGRSPAFAGRGCFARQLDQQCWPVPDGGQASQPSNRRTTCSARASAVSSCVFNQRSGWVGGSLRGADASEVPDEPCLRLGVQPLHVAATAFFDRRIHEHFEELALAHQLTRHLPLGPVGGNEGDEHDQSGIQEQRGYLGNPSDILHPIRLREAQITVQPMPHVIAIEQHAMATARKTASARPSSQWSICRSRTSR